MLILRRKSGESIVIGEDIRVTVLDINEGSVRLAIDAPKVIPILRSELLQAADANRDSAVTEGAQSRDLVRFLGGKPATGSHLRAIRPGAASRFAAPRPAPTQAPQDAEGVTPTETATPESVTTTQAPQGAESVTPTETAADAPSTASAT